MVPPDGQIAPTSRISPDSRGKVPGKLGREGWFGYDFTKPENAPDPSVIDGWGANIGLLADYFPAVDIDVEDETLAKVVLKYAKDILGWAPVRYSRGPRMLLPYRTEEPFPKMALKIWYNDQEHTVEVLGRGRQYLIHGKHPSGVDYRWDTPLLDLGSNDPEDEYPAASSLTLTTTIDVERLFEALEKVLGERGVRTERTGALGLEKPYPDQAGLLAPSLAELRTLIRALPNDYPDRETYIGIGHAIKAAGGQGHAAETLELFQEWAAKWDGGENDPDVVAQDFASFKPPFRVGWPNLYREAQSRAAESNENGEEELGNTLKTIQPPGLDDFEYEDADPALPAPTSGLALIHIDAMLARPKLEMKWVVDGMLPVGGLSLMAAKPKVGKSTLARDLAVAVSKGEPFLGRETTAGPVLYISLEDPAFHVRDEFEILGAAGGNLWVFEGPVTPEAQKLLCETAETLKPVLVIVDTAQRWLRVKDLNDYAQVTAALNPMLELARKSGAHILFIHHSPKGQKEDVADGALGSTALFGSVDIGIFLKRDNENRRYIETRQRLGQPDLEGVLLHLDPTTHRSTLGTTRKQAVVEETLLAVVAYLNEVGRASESEIRLMVKGDTAKKNAALQSLLATGRVVRSGKGKRGDPFTYSVAEDFTEAKLEDME